MAVKRKKNLRGQKRSWGLKGFVEEEEKVMWDQLSSSC